MMSELDPAVRLLLDETKTAYEPRATSRARVHWELERRLAQAADKRRSGAWFVRAGATRTRRWAAGILVGLGSAAALAAYYGGPFGRGSDEIPSPPVESAPLLEERAGARPAEEPSEGEDRRGPEPGEGEREPSSSPADTPNGAAARGAAPGKRGSVESKPPSKSESAESSLRRELELLRQVNAARQAGRPAEALALLERFQRTQSRGVLIQERTAARILALCDLGRRSEARAQAARFAERFPTSPQLPRVLQACKD